MGYVYRPLHKAQLGPGSGPSGKFDCSAWSLAMALDRATMGGMDVTGRQVRLASNEPYPDPDSPGLNLSQLVVVAAKWQIDITNRTRARWSSVIDMLRDGSGVILQGDYDQIPTQYSGQLSFKGDHAVFINHLSNDGKKLWWMDPLNKAGSFYIPATVAKAYADKLATKAGIYPGLFVAQTRETPKLDIAN